MKSWGKARLTYNVKKKVMPGKKSQNLSLLDFKTALSNIVKAEDI